MSVKRQRIEKGTASDIPADALKAHLVPRLHLPEARALRGTCTSLRSVVESVQPEVWRLMAR